MIDLNKIITDKEYVKKEIAKKGFDVSSIDNLYQLLIEVKPLKTELDELRAKRNIINKDQTISVEEKRLLRDKINELESKVGEFNQKIYDIHVDIPNFPDIDAPIGSSEKDNQVIFEEQDYITPNVDEPKFHWDIGKQKDILDLTAASNISGSMFALYKGKGAQLLRALVNCALAMHGDKYTEILPPHMVSSKTLTYTGHLPKFAEEQYKASQDDLWLIPTAEVPITAYYANTTFKNAELPKYSMGYTVCFRREAGSYGKDTRGLQRVHEFHKVELVKIVKPEDCKKELDALLQDCIKMIKALKLHYRIVDLCTADMGDKYGRCYDIEVYAPGVKKWLEVSSVGHFSDYQARRANIKYKNEEGKNQFAYTLNGSGMATPRVWASIIETYQQADGTIKVPEILVPFMGCESF